jgi:chemotaxis regulatin CheY-phosphate phosphatase CheZ
MEKKSPLREIANVVGAMANGDFSGSLSLDFRGELGRLALDVDKIRRNLQTLEPGLKEATENVPILKDGIHSIAEASEEGTHRVITLSESMLDDCDRMAEKLTLLREKSGDPAHSSLQFIGEINERNRSSLLELLTTLAFQDLTGQQLKKLAGVLAEIEGRVLQLLIAFGVAGHATNSGNSNKLEAFREKMETHMDTLKKGDLTQDLVDDILEQLGN